MVVLNKNNTSLIAVGLLLFYVLIPIFPVIMPSIVRYFVLIIIVLFSGISVFLDRKNTASKIIVLSSILLLICLLWIGHFSATYESFISYFFNALLFWIPCIISLNLYKDNIINKQIVYLFLICITVTIITTVIGNEVYPEASRYLAGAASSEESILLSKMNIGGYKFVYAISLIFPYWFYLKDCSGNRFFKKYAIVMIFGTIVLCIVTQYSLSILVLIIESAVILFIKSRNKALVIVLAIALTALYYLFVGYFIQLLHSLSSGLTDSGYNQIADRLLSLGSLLSGYSVDGSTESRMILYNESMKSFLGHPLLGSLFNRNPVGGHSEFIDLLAATGLFGLIPLYIIFKPHVRFLLSQNNSTIFMYMVSSNIGFFFVFLFDTVFTSSTIGVALFLAPIIFDKLINISFSNNSSGEIV